MTSRVRAKAFRSVPKYHAKRTNGYASKREAYYAGELRVRKLAPQADLADWLEQVPVRLSAGIKYVVDFVLIMRDGTVRFVEVKGVETDVWKLKMRLLEVERPEIWARLEIVK